MVRVWHFKEFLGSLRLLKGQGYPLTVERLTWPVPPAPTGPEQEMLSLRLILAL
jgi:hypothetical protein